MDIQNVNFGEKYFLLFRFGLVGWKFMKHGLELEDLSGL